MSRPLSRTATEAHFRVPPTSIHRVEADGVRVFYRAAGDAAAPVLLLLHGFPTSSFMFRDLIPRLANDYRLIAPDLPGFGFTEVPAERRYRYSFDGLALTIQAFTQALDLNRYALYVFDYGAPTGFRLAMSQPDRVTRHRFAERERVRRGSRRCLGSDPAILGLAHGREPGGTSQQHLDAGGNALAIHTRGSPSRTCRARVIHLGHGSPRTPRKQRHPARPILGLRIEREAVSEVSGVFSQTQTASTCHLGQE